jgi:2-oxoglutarate dehydrogenase E1 component
MGDDFLELAGSLPFIDEIYEQYLQNPESVDPSWRRLFSESARPTNGHAARVQTSIPANALPLAAPPLTAKDLAVGRIYGLVNAYRVRGHLEAHLDPLDHLPRDQHPDLDYRSYGFSEADLDRVLPAGGLYGIEEAPLREILRRLRATYCGPIGVEMMHITDTARRTWLQQRLEPSLNVPSLDRDSRVYILDRITAAEQFESFVHTKYVGTKRFSLEGGESLIPLLEMVLERAGLQGVDEVVVGMAHRGRLNVLAGASTCSPTSWARSPATSSPSSRTSIPSRCSAAAT